MRSSHRRLLVFVVLLLVLAHASTASAQIIVAGGNFGVPPTVQDVPYQSGAVNYEVAARIIFGPSAGLFAKHFVSPPSPIDASQSVPLVISEAISIVTEGPPTPRPVSDWHEAIFTKG
jgi:hypothetical protein